MARPNRRRKATNKGDIGMRKCIIKNCPARLPKSGLCIEAPKKKAYVCQECTDCVMKQIVELCKKAPILDADWILNKLDIQECE